MSKTINIPIDEKMRVIRNWTQWFNVAEREDGRLYGRYSAWKPRLSCVTAYITEDHVYFEDMVNDAYEGINHLIKISCCIECD